MIYGYMRVSTAGQVKGNSLEEQALLLQKNGARVIFQDAYTGTSTDRPNFNKLLNTVKEGDTIVITKLDRFARNTAEGLNVIQSLLDQGVKISILNMGTIDSTPTGKLIFTVMLAFAEFERELIVQRTSEGKAIARTKENYVEGRPPKYSQEVIDLVLSMLETNSITNVSKKLGISRSTVTKMKNHQYNVKKPIEKHNEEKNTETIEKELELHGVVIVK